MGAVVGDFLGREHEADEDAVLVAQERVLHGNILFELLDDGVARLIAGKLDAGIELLARQHLVILVDDGHEIGEGRLARLVGRPAAGDEFHGSVGGARNQA